MNTRSKLPRDVFDEGPSQGPPPREFDDPFRNTERDGLIGSAGGGEPDAPATPSGKVPAGQGRAASGHGAPKSDR